MPQIDPTQALSQFVGSLPTFGAVLLAWMNSNSRIGGQNARIAGLKAALAGKIDNKYELLNQKVDATRELLRAEFHRVEEMMDARIKHLEAKQ